MDFNLDFVPSTLDEAVEHIVKNINGPDTSYIQETPRERFLGATHHWFGMHLRNEWSLWEKDTILVQWFRRTLEIDHPDDISSIILDCVWADINKQPRRVEKLVEQYKKHWGMVNNNDKLTFKINKDGEIEWLNNENDEEDPGEEWKNQKD